MNWLEHKYINLLSFRLRNFSKKSGNLYNFSCPFCGDSKDNKRKARGYIFDKSDKSVFFCHNCNESMNTETFIKKIDENLYKEMIIEKLADIRPQKQEDEENVSSKPVFVADPFLSKLKRISKLPDDHYAKEYVRSRKIPEEKMEELFLCENFFRWVNEIIPNKFSEKSLDNDETRLVIPFFDENKILFGVQGRSFDPNAEIRYISIIFDHTKPKIFGLDKVDMQKNIYCVEGPIDSYFVDNCVASAGSDIVSALSHLDKDKIIVIYDNEPRNAETVKKINKSLLNGYKVVIWPSNVKEKDINLMILNGYTKNDIMKIIKQNTYEGINGLVKLKEWKKV
jgi:hypothetical protein